MFLYDFFRSTSQQHQRLLRNIKLTVIAILVCSITSFPLHVTPILFIFTLCIGTAYIIREKNFYLNRLFRNTKITSTITILACAVYAVLSLNLLKETKAVTKWHRLIEGSNTETVEKEIQQYAAIYPILKNNGKFLKEYGIFLMNHTNDYKTAFTLLEESKKYYISYDTYKYLADSYKRAGFYAKAIKEYQLLSWYIPNRFVPKYEIAKLYIASGNIRQAKEVAKSILNMPVKIPSQEVDSIKMEMSIFMNRF